MNLQNDFVTKLVDAKKVDNFGDEIVYNVIIHKNQMPMEIYKFILEKV